MFKKSAFSHKFDGKGVGVSINASFLIFLVVSHINDDPQKKFQKSLQLKTSSPLKIRGNIVLYMFFRLSKSPKLFYSFEQGTQEILIHKIH